MNQQNFMQQPSVPQYPSQQLSVPQYPAQQLPAPQCPAPEYPGQYPCSQQTSINAAVWSQQYVQYVPDWSYTTALLQYQAEIDRLHRHIEQKTLKEEELKNLFTMHGNGYFSTTGSGRVVQLTWFLFKRVEELIYDPLYGRKSQVRIKLTTQVESDLLDMDDFLNDKKFLLFLERLSRSKIKCYSIQRFYHELSIDEDGLFDAVWKEFVIDALEEGAAQYAAPDGLTDIFFCVARDLIRLKRIPCYRTAQCFDAVPHGVAYLDDEHICFDKPAFERVCQEAKCKPSDVKDKLFGKRYFLGKPATTSGRSYETRISLRVNGKGRYTARVYKFERARFEVFGEPALFEGGNG